MSNSGLKKTIIYASIGMLALLFLIVALNNLAMHNELQYKFMFMSTLYASPFVFLAGVFNYQMIRVCGKSRWLSNNLTVSYILQFVLVVFFAILFTVVGFVQFEDANKVLEVLDSNRFKFSVLGTIILNIYIYQTANYVIQFYKTQKQTEAVDEMQNKLLAIQYHQLKSQINPHFLFNSLNVLVSLINSSAEKGVAFTKSLSEVYRYVLANESRDFVSLDEELAFCDKYVHILQMRYGAGLRYEVLQDNDANLRLMILPMAIQMLIENACKHNISDEKNPLLIRVQVSKQVVMVENNRNRRVVASMESSGIGLNNLNEKYKFLTSKPISVQSNDKLFRVTIPVL